MRVRVLTAGLVWFACSSASAWAAEAGFASWSGVYVGLNAGWATADSEGRNLASTAAFADSVPPLTVPFSERISGALAGIQLGYNMQSGSTVAGLEVLANGGWARDKHQYQSPFGAGDDVFEVGIEALLAATGRVGYAWDRNLIYLKAGVAAALIEASVRDNVGPATGSGRDRNWRVGPTVGIGFERALNRTMSVALEYNYIRLSEASYQLGDSTGTYLWRIDVPDVHWAAVRLHYHFN